MSKQQRDAIDAAMRAGHPAEPAMLYFHGGGYVAGSARTGTHLS